MTHTPGPWDNNKWNCDEHQISAMGGTIALVSHDHSLVPEESADANARLIAAAPDLLEALDALEKHSANVNTAFYGRGTAKAMREAMQGQKELLQKARAAIAKATGPLAGSAADVLSAASPPREGDAD